MILVIWGTISDLEIVAKYFLFFAAGRAGGDGMVLLRLRLALLLIYSSILLCMIQAFSYLNWWRRPELNWRPGCEPVETYRPLKIASLISRIISGISHLLNSKC